jgi:hypothetical protein
MVAIVLKKAVGLNVIHSPHVGAWTEVMPHEIPVSILLGYEFRMPLLLSSQKFPGFYLM